MALAREMFVYIHAVILSVTFVALVALIVMFAILTCEPIAEDNLPPPPIPMRIVVVRADSNSDQHHTLRYIAERTCSTPSAA